MKQERSIKQVPVLVNLVLFVSLLLQCIWHYNFSQIEASRVNLSEPPDVPVVRFLSLDDMVTASKILMLWLQAYDNQPGISIPLKELDYDRVINWLDLILKLDNRTEYPLLAAIRFYAEVNDQEKQKLMISFVRDKFLESPDERWQFMTHSVYIAKHRIMDLQLALECAQLIRQYATGDAVPHWAKQMEIFVLEDMGELEAAKIIIGGLLASGELKDQSQRTFLEGRLKEIEEKQYDFMLVPE